MRDRRYAHNIQRGSRLFRQLLIPFRLPSGQPERKLIGIRPPVTQTLPIPSVRPCKLPWAIPDALPACARHVPPAPLPSTGQANRARRNLCPFPPLQRTVAAFTAIKRKVTDVLLAAPIKLQMQTSKGKPFRNPL